MLVPDSRDESQPWPDVFNQHDIADSKLKFRDVAVEFFCLFKGIDEYELYGSAYTVIFCSSS